MVLGTLFSVVAAFSGDAERPNVILIMTDDQGYGDLGFHGNPLIRTPHLDAMASRSARMQTFYVHPVCAPTRACLLTGRYNYRTRAIDTYIGRAMMEPDEVTVAEILREAGYATGIFGKWHLGDCYPMRANDQGFEEVLVHRGGGIGQPSDPPGGERKYTDAILFHNGERVQTKGYCTDVYFDSALQWMGDCKASGKPFFAYIPTNAPHGPVHDVPEGILAEYRKIDLSNRSFPQSKGHKLPEKTDLDTRARVYSMITNVDDNVGRLFAFLKKESLLHNTLVIFMVDNGPNGNRYRSGFKGWKGHVHEGGIRSPFFAHWPAALRPGQTSAEVVAHIDLLPTMLDACEVEVPDGLRLDGRSFLPLLRGQRDTWPDRTIYIQAHRGNAPVRYHHFAARSKRFKLVHPTGFGKENFSGDPVFELYDMQRDPLERFDVADEHPDVVASMKKDYDAWFDDVSSTRPDNYAAPRIHVGTPHEKVTTLTRQDWRHRKGRPWDRHSNGHWELKIAKAGNYRVSLRFPAPKEPVKVTLEIAGTSHESEAGAADTALVFDKIPLRPGNADLLITLQLESSPRGPHQVDVTRND